MALFEIPITKPATAAGFIVEPAGVEPASKHMPNKLSTCLFRDRLSETGQNRTNLPVSYLLEFRIICAEQITLAHSCLI